MTIYNEYLQPLIQWLHINPHWAGIITFLISFSESLAVIGSIIPGSVTMTAIGILIGSGVIPILSTFVWAILGAIAGDSASYFLGFYFKEHITEIWPFKKYPQVIISGKAFFYTHGGKSVFIGRFLGPLRSIIPVIAGMLAMPNSTFLLANISSAFLWSIIYIFPGVLIGAATTELTKETALALLLYVLVGLVLLWLTTWLTKWLIGVVSRYLDRHIQQFWHWMRKHPHLQSLAKSITNPNEPGSYQQLALLLVAFVTLSLFVMISYSVSAQGIITQHNSAIFYIFQSLRSFHLDTFAIGLTFIGEKEVVLFVLFSLFLYFCSQRQWWLAGHWLSNGVVSALLIHGLKYLIHSPRPALVMVVRSQTSYPSGHTTLAIAVYGFLALILAKQTSKAMRRFIYVPFISLLIGIALSRLYLGAHWLSDIIGSSVLALTILSLHLLSYQRHNESQLHKPRLLMTFASSLILAWIVFTGLHLAEQRHAYQQVKPSYLFSVADWWSGKNKSQPVFRKNRLGHDSDILNIQWMGQLSQIEKHFTQQGWKTVEHGSISSAVNRLLSPDKTKSMPLIPYLYQYKRPSLTMKKEIAATLPIVILRLWPSNVIFTDSFTPLWIGSLQYRKNHQAHWLNFNKTPKRRANHLSALSILKKPLQAIWRYQSYSVEINGEKHPIVLIRPKAN